MLLKSQDEAAYPGIAPAITEKSEAAETRSAADRETTDQTPAVARRRRRHPLAWTFAVVALIVGLVGLLAARLAAGPVSLTWAIPLVEPFLADETGPVEVAAATATLDLRDWRQGPMLSLGDVTATSPKFDLSLRTLSGTLSPEGIWAGNVALRRLSARGVRLSMRLPTAAPPAERPHPTDDRAAWLADLLRPPATGPLARLQTVDVADVLITLALPAEDGTWQARIGTAQLHRRPGGFDGSADLRFDQDGVEATAALTFARDPAGGTDGRLQFQGVRPPALAPLLPSAAAAAAAALDLPLSGRVEARLNADGDIGAFSVAATGGAGALVLSPALAERIGQPAAAQRLAVSDLTLKASADPAGHTWVLDEFALRADDEAVLRLPQPLGLALPLRRIEAGGRLAGAVLTVDRAILALDGGPEIAAHGTIEDPLTAARGEVEAVLTGATIADVRRYWPQAYGKDAYEWISEHFTAGRIGDARLQATIATEDGATDVTALALTIPLDGAVVDYLPPQPPIRNASALIDLDLTSLRAAVSRGSVGGLAIADGRVIIPDLDKDVPSIDIDVRASGPAAAAVDILATPPFEFLDGTGITGSQADGSVDARIRLGFPLLDELELEQMDINVAAMASGLALRNLYHGLALTDGSIRFEVSEDGLRARGPLRFAGIAGILDWEEDFLPTTPLHTDLIFTIVRADLSDVRRGLAGWIDADRWLKSGYFAGDVRYTAQDDGSASIDGRIDLGAAEVEVPELHWRKPAGRAALAEANAALLNGRLDAIDRIALSAADADIHGYVLFDGDGHLYSLGFDRFQLGRTRIAGNLHAIDHRGWEVTVYGQALDIEPFITGEGTASDTAKATGDAAASKAEPAAAAPDLIISAGLQTVWLGTEEPLQSVLIDATRTNAVWDHLQVQAETGSGAPFALTLVPAEDGSSRLSASASDAGATLEGFGILSTMVGGTLEVDGRLERYADRHRLLGELKIHDFRLVRAPLLARALEVLALTGLRDLLTGRGMSFRSLRIPFEESDGVVEIEGARVAGPTIGLTGSGQLDLDGDSIDVRGIIVPFYWANNLVASIPVIGPLLTGGADGGGLLSATYRLTGPLGEPVLNVNPYSFVLPTVVRHLLELIQSWLAPTRSDAALP